MKIVINECFGGFKLSKEAYDFLGLEWNGYGFEFIDDRTNPDLVRCVETLGERASASGSRLVVVEVPDDVQWYIRDYDGDEQVEEVHRIWY